MEEMGSGLERGLNVEVNLAAQICKHPISIIEPGSSIIHLFFGPSYCGMW